MTDGVGFDEFFGILLVVAIIALALVGMFL